MKKVAFFLMLIHLSHWATAQIVLPKLISDNMVLQRDEPLKIWGWSSAGEKITLTFNKKSYKTTASAAGKWEIDLPAQPASVSNTFIFTGKNTVSVKNIAFGDVWFCSGQSNMVHQMQHHDITYAAEIAQANNPEIRQFLVPTLTNLNGPQADYPAGTAWKNCNPVDIRSFSAVAYFFAKQINATQGVPVGIINASVGGTPIEAWTSESGFKNFKNITATIQRNKDTTYVNSFKRPAFSPAKPKDRGLLDETKWYEPNLSLVNWKTINVPGYWEDQGVKDLNGVVWYRKNVNIPANIANQEANIYLGRIVDADVVYLNGQQIAVTTYQYPQRRYKIPAGILKSGQNLITVKVSNTGGKGGFVPDKPYYLTLGSDTLDLKGTWHYRVGEVFESQPNNRGFSAQNQPTALFNAMAAPATAYKITGVLWYQGESNASQPQQYEALQVAQINDWRTQWNNPDLPFLFVQLPNYMDASYSPTESRWAELREGQRQALKTPNTAMAVAIDLGEWNDIHPDNKKDVGDRLALAARKLVYKEDIHGFSPMLLHAKTAGSKVILQLENVASGLISKDGEALRGFALAADDKKFVWAKAQLTPQNEFEVWNETIQKPKYLRYAWADNPDVNLYSKEGLPASPFEVQLNKQESELWHGKKAAVVLTYDDALNVHLDNAIPALEARGLQGTFYLSVASPGSVNRIADWKRAAFRGHELGNHTVYHPCDTSKPGRTWVSPERDLSNYSTAQMLNEIRLTNAFLEALDGKKERTFAYTCGDTETGEGSFVQAIKNDFVAARGTRGQLNQLGQINLLNVDCFVVNGESGEQLIKWVKDAVAKNALVTILFHGVGGEHGLNVSLEAHNQLLDYLQANQEDIWTTTMLEAAKHIQEKQ